MTQGKLIKNEKNVLYTAKIEKKNFLIYKEIRNGAVAKSPHIRLNICEFPYTLGSPSSYMTLQLLHSKFP
jgi:hypothetical protein